MRNVFWRKSVITLALAAFVAAGSNSLQQADAANAAAIVKPKIKVDTKDFQAPQGEPEAFVNEDGRTMVPIRFISYALGLEEKDIVYEDDTDIVHITRNGHTVDMQVGNQWFNLDGKSQMMDTKPFIKQERMFIPLRYVGEALGAGIDWDEETETAYILSEKNSNLARYGYKMSRQLPVALSANGLELTVDSIFMYPAKLSSEQFRDYADKYLTKEKTAKGYDGTTDDHVPNKSGMTGLDAVQSMYDYMIQAKVTLKNASDKQVYYGMIYSPKTGELKENYTPYFTFLQSNARFDVLHTGYSKKEYFRKYNNPELMNLADGFVIEPGESYSTTAVFYMANKQYYGSDNPHDKILLKLEGTDSIFIAEKAPQD